VTGSPGRRRGLAYLSAALLGVPIGLAFAFLPAANAWVPVWATALDPATAKPPRAELYRMNADGTGQTRLTISDVDERSPAVSPDGTRVAVKLWPAEGEAPQTLAVVDLLSGERLDLLTEGSVNQPSWSPDGTRILFGWGRDAAPDIQLWSVAADGSGEPERLLEGEQNSFAGQWSPDGRSLLFASDRDSFGIYVANADGTDIHKIIDQPRYADAAWSPDSRFIAFTADLDGGWGLSVVDADGSGLRLVHGSDAATLIPDWSPDGRTLIYEDHQDPGGEVYSVSIDGTNEQNLTRNPGVRDAMGGPTVAPDGRIIYAAAGYLDSAFNAVVRERLGVAALTAQSLLLALGAALLVRRGAAPFGVLTLMTGVAAGVALGWHGAWVFLPAAVLAGFAADVVRRLMPDRPWARVVAIGTLTGGFTLGYFATVALATEFGMGFGPTLILAGLGAATAVGVLIGSVAAMSAAGEVAR
jgi:Tol biopolymer transport system component